MKSSGKATIDERIEYMMNEIANNIECDRKILRRDLRYFTSNIKKFLKCCNYKDEVFRKAHHKWLLDTVKVHKEIKSKISKPGRPTKPFDSCGVKTKLHKTKELRAENSSAELLFSAEKKAREEKRFALSNLIKEATSTDHSAEEMLTKYKRPHTTVRKATISEALSLFVDGNFTRRQWDLLHQFDKEKFPCYSVLQKAKVECFPENVIVSEREAEVKLQSLLDHTSQRLCMELKEVIVEHCTEEEQANMELISKWGSDGTSQEKYNQKFEDSTIEDDKLYVTSLVPIRLNTNITNADGSVISKVIWSNPTPSSPRFCRPVKITYIKETAEVTKREYELMQDQIRNLEESRLD
ncbi:uncharacterized protein DMENIID0001_062370 [Sergentomyia squamirostris]